MMGKAIFTTIYVVHLLTFACDTINIIDMASTRIADACNAKTSAETISSDSSPRSPLQEVPKSSWTQGLKKVGLYFSGFVEDIDTVLESHCRDTITYYRTRTSVGIKENVESSEGGSQEAHRHESGLSWKHNAAGSTISFQNTPFQIGYKYDLECQFSNHYFKNKQKPGGAQNSSQVKKPGLRMQAYIVQPYKWLN
uniref:Uncharacterized protein n=1 Tax=Amphimedon queenslandica TaxID=400682 RepID=A0A1X7V4G8_AMPQE